MTDDLATKRNLPAPTLNDAQQRFVEELVKDPRRNAAAAARRAGYSEDSARFTASALLAHPPVAAALAVIEAKLSARAKLSREQLADLVADQLAAAVVQGNHHAVARLSAVYADLHGWRTQTLELGGSIEFSGAAARQRIQAKIASLYASKQIAAGAPVPVDPPADAEGAA